MDRGGEHVLISLQAFCLQYTLQVTLVAAWMLPSFSIVRI
jgi:hypothetical protein